MKFEKSRLRNLVVVLLAVALPATRSRIAPRSESQGTEKCDSIYLRFSPDHVMCQSCRLISPGINNTEKDTILAIHNRYRNLIALGNTSTLPPASDMLELEWDDELAAVAQAYANLCRIHSVCWACTQIEKFPYVTDLMRLVPTDSEDKNRDWEDYVKSMYEEVRQTSLASLDSPIRTTLSTLGFSTLARSGIWRVGCGFAEYPLRGPGRRFQKRYICVYGPGIILEGEDVYKVGQACSDCPEGTCCGSSCRRYGFTPSFEGLCKVIRDGPSPAIVEEDLLWTCQFNTDTKRGCVARSEPADAFVTKMFFALGFAETVLQAGQSAEMTFEQIIRPSRGSLCAVVEYSKGPDVAGQADRGIFNLVATPVERPERQRTINLPGHLPGSSVALVEKRENLTFNVPLQIGFSFVVPEGSQSQYLKIRSVAVYDKACSV